MTDTEQKKASKEFVALWKDRGDEKQETQQFWSDLLHRVFGITNFSSRVQFEKPVPLLHTSFIDVYIPETKVIIEQKSMDIDLLKRKKQSDGSELNPFEQAQRYGGKLPYSERPRWIVTCNFQKFLIYDMDAVRPEEKPIEVLLEELPDKYHLLSFLIDSSVKKITVEQQLSFKAGELVGKLYDLMLPQYKDPTAESTLQALNKFCVRIVFCLYAEDAMLFGSKGSEFHDYLASFLPENRRDALIKLFRMLDTKEDDRDAYENKKLLDFPYVNGGLFADEIEIPQITDEIAQLILVDMSEKLDWSKISPTIFGAVFESTLNPETRRSGGMHYTSIRDIHKVIDPLFLDDLQTEFDNILHNPKLSNPKRKGSLEAFQNRLAQVHFLDPACGSGNFLTETFLSIRRLENKVIEHLLKGMMVLEFANPVKVSIGQFAGIEINDFAVTVARTALWIAESQMIKETEAIVNQTIDFFPLKTDAKIVEGNALQMDWNNVISKYSLNYIMGNPPFVGYKFLTPKQKADVFSFMNNRRAVDYVAGWYYKSASLIQGTRIECALVSTNSITQGSAIQNLWSDLLKQYPIKINFAWKTFDWNNESIDSAAVKCVIIGFASFDRTQKILFDEKSNANLVNTISPRLTPEINIIVDRIGKPIQKNVLPMTKGAQLIDGGNFIIGESEDKAKFIKENPSAEPYVYRYLNSRSFINNSTKQYCLYLKNCPLNIINKTKGIYEIVKKVQDWRLNQDAQTTKDLAINPSNYFQSQVPQGNCIVVPVVSSANRKYIPIDFLQEKVVCTNALFFIDNANIYIFGILNSNVHMAWTRQLCGRLKSDYRYSNSIIYNNFPFPDVNEEQKKKIEITAQNILDTRAKYPNTSLAELYDFVTMPIDLKKAHQLNDRAVMEAYGMWGKVNSESECVAWLFRMYEELTK